MFLITTTFNQPDTVVLESVDDVIDRQEGHVDDIHFHIESRRHCMNTRRTMQGAIPWPSDTYIS